MSEEVAIKNAFERGVISEEERDKLLDDIAPLLWANLFNREGLNAPGPSNE